MKLKIVDIPSIAHPLRTSPGFAKKKLSDYALDLRGLCDYGCRYCSSNLGNYLRFHQAEFLELTIDQLGEGKLPAHDPELSFRWPDVLAKLEATLDGKRLGWGEGRTVVFSMLTDGFSPSMVADGTTRKALELVIARTGMRIRVLTKNACVGSNDWIEFFARYPGRFVVGLSIGTLDDAWSKRVEVNTSPPSQRVKALRRLQDAGVPTYGMLCPIFPDVFASGIDELVTAIRPELCETVWAEPYNDRANWRHVRDGHPTDSDAYALLSQIFESSQGVARWSRYATDLFLALRHRAVLSGWLDKLVYLLYEDKVRDEDVARLRGDLHGVLLQGRLSDEGFSRNAAFAEIQRRSIRA